MKIKIDKNKMPINFELNEKIDCAEHIFDFCDNIAVKGELSLIGEDICAKGFIYGKIKYNCDRCFDECFMDVNFEFNEVFMSENAQICDYVYENNTINLDDMVLHNVLLNLPTQLICKTNCKGMCQGCYKNLNFEECGC